MSLLVTPLAAQTVYLTPYKSKTDAAAHEKSMHDAARDGAIVNKMNAINDAGPNGYDIVAFDSRVRGVRGTSFLVPTWSQGDVLLGTATKATPAVVKFDVYNQQLRVWRAAQNDSIIIAPEDVKGFTLRPTGAQGQPVERHFELLPNSLVPELPIAYAEDLSTGSEVRLLRLYKKTILKGHADSSYGNNTPIDSFQDATQYFLRWGDGTCTVVKPNRSSILAAFAVRHADKASAEMHDKTKLRSDADLGGLVARLDSILKARP
ncbi:hypothetical protein GCM10028822_04380 [Hymenobacter terrigena]